MKSVTLSRIIYLVLIALLATQAAFAKEKSLGWPGEDLKGVPCRGGEGGFGPYDYTDPYDFKEKLPIVNMAHFTKKVERLIAGESGSFFGGDLDYTVRAFPNHHRALHAIMRYATQRGWENQRSLPSKPVCYFQRAIVFRPDDGIIRLIFGTFLHRRKIYDRALKEYQAALELIPDNLSLHYNLGLLYAELKQYDKAKEHARICYSNGFHLTGLKRKLANAGYKLE